MLFYLCETESTTFLLFEIRIVILIQCRSTIKSFVQLSFETALLLFMHCVFGWMQGRRWPVKSKD